MEIRITLEQADWWKYQVYIEKVLRKKSRTWIDGFWVNIFIWMIIGVVFMAVFQKLSEFHWPTAISVAVLFVMIAALFIYDMLKIRKAYAPMKSGVFCGDHKFTFTESGFEYEGKGYQGRCAWEIVKKVERVQGMILIYLDTVFSYVFPESKLENPDELYNYIQEQYTNSKKVG